jgi:branched-chain amino acid transport system substrate-binding protein
MKNLTLGAALAAAAVAGLSAQLARADEELKIGVVAAESGSFVSAGNTIVAAAKLASQQINDAGGVKIGGKTYKIKLYIRDNRTDVNVTIAAARELVDDVGVKAIWGTETHDFSVSMAKITGAAKVIQFSGNSSLGAVLDDKSVAPGGWLHYTFQSEPQEWQRSGSTAKGVLSLLTLGGRAWVCSGTRAVPVHLGATDERFYHVHRCERHPSASRYSFFQ